MCPIESRSGPISGVSHWCRTNRNKRRLSAMAPIHHVWWLNRTGVSQTCIQALRCVFAAQLHVEFTQTSLNEVFRRNFQMKTFPPLCCADAPYHVTTHMELWVMSQALTDRTCYTCLYPVYSMTRRVCSSLVFSFCVTQVPPLTGSAYSPPQKSPEGQNVSASFLLLLHPALFLILFCVYC